MAGPPSNGPGFGGTGPGVPSLPPPPQVTLDQVERALGQQSSGTSVSSNAALLEAIRESSRVTASKMEVIQGELKGFRKDFTTLRKDLDPLIKYYQKKAQKWASIEEQFFREGMKLIAKLNGAPPPESSYDKTKYGASSSSSSLGRARDASGKFVSAEEDRQGPITTAARAASFWKAWSDETQKWSSGLKTATMYVQTPIKLFDAAFTRIGGGISLLFRRAEENAQEKARKAKDIQDKASKEAEELHEKEVKRLEEGEKLDEFFDRLRRTLHEVLAGREDNLPAAVTPTTMSVQSLVVASMVIGSLLVGSLVIGALTMASKTRGEEEPERNATPYGERSVGMLEYQTKLLTPPSPDRWLDSLPQRIASYGRRFHPDDDLGPVRNVTPGAPEPRYGPIAGLLTGPSLQGPEGVAGLLPESPGPPPFLGGNDYEQQLQDSTLDIWEPYLGEMSRFFLAPENTEVGRFLTKLITGTMGQEASGSNKGEGKSLKIELPLIVQLALLAAGVGIALIGAALLVLAIAVAQVLPDIIKAVVPILVAVGDGIEMIVRLVGSLGGIIIQFVGNVLQTVSKILAGIGDAVVSFLNDPGAFVDRLVTGIGDGIQNLLGSLTSAIGKAFEDIPILRTISNLLDTIGTSIGVGVAAVISGVATTITASLDLVKDVIKGMASSVTTLLGIGTAIIAVLGGSIALGISMVAATISGLVAWFMAGGLNPLRGDAAAAAFRESYGTTMGSMAGLTEGVADSIKDEAMKSTVKKVAQVLANEGMAKDRDATERARRSVAGAGESFDQGRPQTVNNSSSTVVQQVPTFAAIPLYGGGF